MTVDEICQLSNLNTANVRSYLKNIYGKWHVSHQAAFVAEASPPRGTRVWRVPSNTLVTRF